MKDVMKLQPEQQELDLIPVERTSVIPAAVLKKVNPNLIRKKRNRAVGRLIGITVASLLLNMVQAFIIYILQAGPI